MNEDRKTRFTARGLLIAAAVITILKIWLTRSQHLFAIGGAGLDDQLFVDLASNILRGHWLGGYTEATLAKGPLYSCWIASLRWLGIPLRLGDQLAYAGACALVVLALFPLVKKHWHRLTLYLLLLWNPMSYEMAVLGRVLRQNIYTPITLALIACMIALCLRPARSLLRLLPWACAAGLLWAAFWLTREEGVWLAPSLALLTGCFVVVSWIHGRFDGLRRAAQCLGAALVCALLPLLLVCCLNQYHYRWFGTVEFRAHEFNDAYGALTRLTPDREIPLVPVTRQMRESLYPHCPTLALLKPSLEGELGRSWAKNSTPWTHIPEEELQIAGGWFMWLLRDSVARAGYANDAAQSLAFYQRLADEVNAACDKGLVPAGPRRSGFLPPWRPGQTREWLLTSVEAADFFASFRGFTAHAPTSLGNPEQIAKFREITGEIESPMRGSSPPPATYLSRIEEFRTELLQNIGRLLRHPLFVLTLASVGFFLYLLYRAARLRRLRISLVIAAALLGACLACVLIIALVNVTSFPTIGVGGFAQAYPLLLLFDGLMLFEASLLWSGRIQGEHCE